MSNEVFCIVKISIFIFEFCHSSSSLCVKLMSEKDYYLSPIWIWRWISVSVFESIRDCRQIYLGFWWIYCPDWTRLWNLLQLSVYRLMRDLMIHLMIHSRRDLNNCQQPYRFRSWAPCSTFEWFMQWQWLFFMASDVSSIQPKQADPPKSGRRHERKTYKSCEQFFDWRASWRWALLMGGTSAGNGPLSLHWLCKMF